MTKFRHCYTVAKLLPAFNGLIDNHPSNLPSPSMLCYPKCPSAKLALLAQTTSQTFDFPPLNLIPPYKKPPNIMSPFFILSPPSAPFPPYLSSPLTRGMPKLTPTKFPKLGTKH